ncbi:MAG: hypothetical protein KDA75_01645 [Planctomycetaceae bacterium]|nr:hypothetical protein [Planctomycetaceae bacterium]
MACDDGSEPAVDKVLRAFGELFDGLLSQPESRQQLKTFFSQLATALGDEDATPNVDDTTLIDIPVVAAVASQLQRSDPPVPADVVSSAEAIRKLKWAQSTDSRLSEDERQEVAEKVDSAPDAPFRNLNWRSVSDQELVQIPARCQLKADACRWKLERRRLMDAGHKFAEEIEPRDKDLIAQAKALPDCFLWMNWQEGPAGGASTAWETLAECFDTLAEVVSLLEQALPVADDFPDLFKDLLYLVAEAQSAVRSGARSVDYEDEQEQDRTYNWLKRTAAERGHYISRFMRVDDRADPTQSADLLARVREFGEAFEARRAQDKVRRKRLGQLKYVASQIREEPDADQSYNWDKLINAVDELVDAGEPPSSKVIRSHLLPILEAMPAGDLPPNVEMVLREIDRFLADNPDEEPVAADSTRTTPDIAAVAQRLQGRTMVLIGGVRKPGHVQALQDAFQLKEVVWVPTREHQSVTKFEPFVRQPDVAVVVLAIRWTSHSYGEVKEFCDQYGKPFVRLKAGYNPVQVAAHIMEQVSDQLPAESAQSESA